MSKQLKLILSAAALLMIPSISTAQEMSIGQREFEANCAVCHGLSGKGDGPLSGYLTQKSADLTVLSANNNGVFPFNAVYESIDGRRMVAAHGTRDMPVWGHEYDEKAVNYYTDFPGSFDPESFIRGRILALTVYLYELQGK